MAMTIGGVNIPNAEEKFVEMSHGTTRYIEAGTGYPTILLHGVGFVEGGHNWLLNIGPLSEHLKIIAVDALAWGKGQGFLNQEYSFAYLVDFLREFQDALGLEKTNLVGHSMGGWLGSLFGYESPNRLNKLVLVASGGAMPRQLKSMVEFQPPTREFLLEQQMKTVKSPLVDHEAYADYRFEMAQNPERLASYRNVLAHMNNMETRSRYNTVRRFSHITVPTLVVWGKDDQINAMEMGEMTRDGIPGAEMVVFDCGHFIPSEEPDGFNKAVGEFLAD